MTDVVFLYSFYPAIYFLTEWGTIDCKTQHELYLFNDVLTKFSYTLMISAGSIRFIEVLEEHRAKVVIQMSQVQRSFFFNITHELRTPLNSIIGFNTLAMESGELTEFADSFIKASLTSAEALLGLINQILDFAKFEGAKDLKGGGASIELNSDVWTVRQLVEQVTDLTQKASVRGVDLVITLASPEHFNTKFVGDFFRLRQCCVNLVDNAIKYSSNVEGRTALVEFSIDVEKSKTHKDKSVITFAIEDNGVGIPAEKQHTLFVPFCQPADHKTAKEKGTGLGLVITKAIIECMGGNIDFKSDEGNGTVFFFTLDFVRAREASIDGGGEDADFVEDSSQLDSLPAKARIVFHPSMNESTRKHVTCIMKCVGGKPGVNYVTVPGEDKLKDKIRQASLLGVPVVLMDVINLTSSLDFIKSTPKAGIIILGLPYQLMELHKNISDMRNVQTVLKPVKPSDLLKAVAKLARSVETGDLEFLHDTTDSEDGVVQKRLEHAEIKAAENTLIKTQVPEGADGSTGELKGMTVLLVEDNIMNQQMAKFSILKCGADLEIAMHGQEAVDQVTNRFNQGKPGYDCILMDMMMPIMDGAAATIEIRDIEKKRKLPPQTIVGLSANVGPEYTARVKAAGMDGSMSKPFYPATLRNTLLNVKKGTYAGFSRLSVDKNSLHTTIEDKPGN